MSLRVSPGPHILSRESTRTQMLDVLIALIPAVAAGIYLFGLRALWMILAAVLSAVAAEFVWQKLMKKPVTVLDLSAAVTGLIIGLNMPSSAPLWLPVIAGFIAIIMVKQLFGGLGHNFMNPAMFARAVLLASWPVHMTRFVLPVRMIGQSTAAVDAIASATPLVDSKIDLMDLFMGNIPGSIGEVCKAAILIGLVYLLLMKTITWHVPVSFIGSVALISYLLGADPLRAILTGGVLFGAVFMATDPVTNPMYKHGQILFGILAGLIVVVIRKFGNYPEGVTYALLFVNSLTPLIDRYTKRRVYGEVKANGKK